MDLAVSSLIGGIIGLLIAVMLEEPLNSAKRRFVKWFRMIFYRPRLTTPPPQTFGLGRLNTSWLVIDGDGGMTYSPATIRCIVDNTPASLPPEIIQLRSRIEEREIAKMEKGLDYQRNGPLYALDRYHIGRTQPDEHMEVVFTFRPTDYYTFQATVKSLDENSMQSPSTATLRQEYLQGRDLSQPIPSLANGFVIALVIITKDKKLVLSHRSDRVGVRPGELDASVVEGVHPVLDRSSIHRGPDLYRTAIRGAQEEIGIELVQEEITFLGFGVDIEYYQWNMIGVARISETAHEALEHRRRGIGGKWETRQFEIIESDPRSVFSYLKNQRIWSTGLVAVYWALVHYHGRKRVDSAVKAVLG